MDLVVQPVDVMIEHLEEVTKTDNLVTVKETFQTMAIDVIAKVETQKKRTF